MKREAHIVFLTREFTFDSAHNLVRYHGKCEKLHGHTYRMAVTLSGHPDDEGMLMDFVELKRIVHERIIAKFDHAYLNDIVAQPTAENIARYVFEALDPLLRGPNFALHEVCVWETARSFVAFRREDLPEGGR